ncbi:DinB family protein [Gordonia hankookensis]|uniref:DinB family protein n=1 Tax=Gordonia hankookensis TaxID=589403 RepID=A0ABR7WI87_9ACTN|nr:DinB family protein [Gordonia hankookensis]MBD1322463.1 DinB family protein [Gordonia hankookensis]
MTEQLGPERAILESVLDANRFALIDRVSGLSDAQARMRLVPSLTTPLSLVKHCAAAERVWFQRTLAALPPSRCDGYATGDDHSWLTSDSETVGDVVAEYQRACARSREIAGHHDLDEVAEHYRRGAVTLRWIFTHMIEELARHAGHADILVEQISAGAQSV